MEDNSLLELVELSNGDVALRRVSDDSLDSESIDSVDSIESNGSDDAKARSLQTNEPLLRIQFSDESELALNSLKMTVARAMVEAGIEAYAEIQAVRAAEELDSNDEDSAKTLH